MSKTMDKRLLIVIDMQNDFIDGALGTPEAVAILPNVKKIIEDYKAAGDNIIFTRDTHYDNYLRTSEGHNLPVPHCIKNTFGWKIHEDLDTDAAIMLLNKNTFGMRDWNYYDFDYKEITLVGLCTDICVVSNALILKAAYPEIPITVIADCCAGVTPETHKAALDTMRMCQINIV